MAKPDNYGGKLWCITGAGDPLYIYADRMEVSGGALLAIGGYRADKNSDEPDDEPVSIYGIAAGQWHTFYAASGVDGGMVCSTNYDG